MTIPTTPAGALLTYDEVAKQLRLSVRQIASLVKVGKLRAVKLGPRSVRFDPADVQRFIDGCKGGAA